MAKEPKSFVWLIPERSAGICETLAKACGWDAELFPAKADENDVVVLKATEKARGPRRPKKAK